MSSNAGPFYDPNPREINYTGPEPFVYPVIAWHQACNKAEQGVDNAYEQYYWQLGMTLSQYVAEQPTDGLWQHGGEIILDPQYIKSHRNVSIKRAQEAAPQMYPDLAEDVKRWQRRAQQ